MPEEKWGEWAFLVGVLLALLVGLFSGYIGAENLPIVFGILTILGLIVGLLNITEKEVNSFLIAAIALMGSGSALYPLSTLFPPQIVSMLSAFLGAIGVFVAPAALVIALKAIYNLAKK